MRDISGLGHLGHSSISFVRDSMVLLLLLLYIIVNHFRPITSRLSCVPLVASDLRSSGRLARPRTQHIANPIVPFVPSHSSQQVTISPPKLGGARGGLNKGGSRGGLRSAMPLGLSKNRESCTSTTTRISITKLAPLPSLRLSPEQTQTFLRGNFHFPRHKLPLSPPQTKTAITI